MDEQFLFIRLGQMRKYIRHNRQQWIVIEITYLSTTTTWIVGVIVIFKDIIKCVHRNHLVGCCVGKSFYIILYTRILICQHTHTTNTKYIYKAIETERMKVYIRNGKDFLFGWDPTKHRTHTHFIYIECTRYGKNRLYGLWFFHVDFVLYKDRRAMYI